MADAPLGVDRAARGAVMRFWPGVGRADFRDAARRRQAPEKHLQHLCRQAAALQGYTVWHLSQARASAQSAGLPDDLLTGGPQPIAVEYKAGRNGPTAAQRAFQAAWEASGGRYLVVRSVGALLEALDDGAP